MMEAMARAVAVWAMAAVAVPALAMAMEAVEAAAARLASLRERLVGVVVAMVRVVAAMVPVVAASGLAATVGSMAGWRAVASLQQSQAIPSHLLSPCDTRGPHQCRRRR